jgi:hypothetical protein
VNKFCFIFFILLISIFAQRTDFYDTYDYNLRNLKGADSGGNEENFKEYDVPPSFQKPPLISPKNVQRQPDLSSLLQGRIGVRQSANQQNQGQPVPNQAALPFNPLTGQLNPEAILQQREKEKKSKERKNQLLHSEKELYSETRDRRMQVIFLTTFPFAGLFAIGLASLIDTNARNLFQSKNNQRFINTTGGFFFVMGFATLVSGTNAYLDIKYYDEYMRNKETNAVSSSDELKAFRNINISFTVGEISF